MSDLKIILDIRKPNSDRWTYLWLILLTLGMLILGLTVMGCAQCQHGDVQCWQDEARLAGSAAAILINREAKPEHRAVIRKAGPVLVGFLKGDSAALGATVKDWLDRELPGNPDNANLSVILGIELARLRQRFGGEGLPVPAAGVEAMVNGVRP